MRHFAADHDVGVVTTPAADEHPCDLEGEGLVHDAGYEPRDALYVGLTAERGGEFIELRVAGDRALNQHALVLTLERDGDEPAESIKT